MVQNIVQNIVELLVSLPEYQALAFVFFFAFIENLFPPSPSDVVLVVAGTLVGLGTVGFIPMLVTATAGSAVGFVVMFEIGRRTGGRVTDSRLGKFIPLEALGTAEAWFRRWGYGIIVANRFLSGTRAIISFFAGVSGLDRRKTFLLSFISAGIWNAILIFAGVYLGERWEQFNSILSTYSTIVTLILLAGVLWMVYRWWVKSKRA